MKRHPIACCLLSALLLAGCKSAPAPASSGPNAPTPHAAAQLSDKPFVLEVLRHVYRWHFDQSYVLGARKDGALEVWTRQLGPKLDPDDRSLYAEMWIPAVNTLVELKRADYTVPELRLNISDASFKVRRVTRLERPKAPRTGYKVNSYHLQEVRDYVFATRTNRLAISDGLRTAARRLIGSYLVSSRTEPFTEPQTAYIAPLSAVSNDLWVFWETGRKLLLFSADMDLSNPGFAETSQLNLEVIDLDKDIVASTSEVPGSNAFVTKDWVGRLFFNCILYGEKVVRTPEELNELRTGGR
jgi:hypothetical protein